MALRIHPRLGALKADAVVRAVLDALATGTPGGRMMATEWRQAGTLRVERTPPVATLASKILALDAPPN